MSEENNNQEEQEERTIFQLAFGFYPGILFGFRTYEEENLHVLYIPFLWFSLIIGKHPLNDEYDEDEHEGI